MALPPAGDPPGYDPPGPPIIGIAGGAVAATAGGALPESVPESACPGVPVEIPHPARQAILRPAVNNGHTGLALMQCERETLTIIFGGS